MYWITRERPKIDRIACPWLIKRFIGEEATFLFVPFADVIQTAERLGGTPFDVPGVEFTHYEDHCTFDYFIEKYDLQDQAVHTIAKIVRAADTDRHDLAPQAAGLWAVFAGLSFNIKDDTELLRIGLLIYDALYAWATHLQDVTHTGNYSEGLLLEIYTKFLAEKSTYKKTPHWVKELREMIQDQMDTNLSLSLGEVARGLEIHPAYLSREFSKHFDNHTFGAYMRKLWIEKAVKLLDDRTYTLSEIAYLTGFSDQSHFTRIFKKQMGVSPGVYRKKMRQGKEDSKS